MVGTKHNIPYSLRGCVVSPDQVLHYSIIEDIPKCFPPNELICPHVLEPPASWLDLLIEVQSSCFVSATYRHESIPFLTCACIHKPLSLWLWHQLHHRGSCFNVTPSMQRWQRSLLVCICEHICPGYKHCLIHACQVTLIMLICSRWQ